ncbi:MAG: CYTH domain-containing protein [Elusimicrobiaceae bacterium]|nr:CYTH domain-containing protein [Elusimicrobiaceae bacterium]
MNHVEQEFKWTCNRAADFDAFLSMLKLLPVHCIGPKELHIVDTYLDTAQRKLSSQKIALRLRRTYNRFEVTLKTKTALQKGMATRKEITIPLKKAATWHSALKQLKEKNRWEGVELALLQRIFTIENYRRAYQLSYKKCTCELALDQYLTKANGHQWLRREIELELKKGAAKDFLQLVQKITHDVALPVAKISKVAGAEKWIKEKLRIN